MYVYACVCLCMSAYVCAYLCMSVYAYTCLCIPAYVCACVCERAFIADLQTFPLNCSTAHCTLVLAIVSPPTIRKYASDSAAIILRHKSGARPGLGRGTSGHLIGIQWSHLSTDRQTDGEVGRGGSRRGSGECTNRFVGVNGDQLAVLLLLAGLCWLAYVGWLTWHELISVTARQLLLPSL